MAKVSLGMIGSRDLRNIVAQGRRALSQPQAQAANRSFISDLINDDEFGNPRGRGSRLMQGRAGMSPRLARGIARPHVGRSAVQKESMDRLNKSHAEQALTIEQQQQQIADLEAQMDEIFADAGPVMEGGAPVGEGIPGDLTAPPGEPEASVPA